MSSSNEGLKKALKELLNDANSVKMLFGVLESEYKKEQANLNEVKNWINTISPTLKKESSQWGAFENILNGMILMSKKYNDNFNIVHTILEILCLKINAIESLQPLPDIPYNPQSMISREDRDALDWLKNYFQHATGEDVGQ